MLIRFHDIGYKYSHIQFDFQRYIYYIKLNGETN